MLELDQKPESIWHQQRHILVIFLQQVSINYSYTKLKSLKLVLAQYVKGVCNHYSYADKYNLYSLHTNDMEINFFATL